MITNELLETIKKINRKLKSNSSENKNENILASCVKLQEETWELAWEILTFLKRARIKKIENFKFEDLENEFADVIFSLLVLALDTWVDINKAIKNKLEIIKNRGRV